MGQLDYSQWELTIQVTSRNLPGRELVISYLRRQYGGAPSRMQLAGEHCHPGCDLRLALPGERLAVAQTGFPGDLDDPSMINVGPIMKDHGTTISSRPSPRGLLSQM